MLSMQLMAQRSTTVSAALDRMANGTRTERQNAFSDAVELIASGRETSHDIDRLRLGIIQLLARENKATKASAKQPIADDNANDESIEAYEEYYAGLVGFVAGLGDERAIPALLGAAGTGGMATRGVARFGKKAVGAVLEQVASKDPRPADDALFVILEMLKMHTASDPDSHRRIKSALRSALDSQDAGVRESAIYAIEYLDDRDEFLPVLRYMAERDPGKLAGQPKEGGTVGDYYFVREDAAKLLRKIANHEAPAVDQGVDR